MKYKQKVDVVIESLLILLGVVLLLLPILGFYNIKHIFFIVMIIYGFLNLAQFLLTLKSKDYEGLYTFIVCLAFAIVGISFDFSNPIQLSISLVAWTFLMCIIKLVKASYYNDLRDRM